MESEDEAHSTNGHGPAESIASTEVIQNFRKDPPPSLKGDITFEAIPGGFEIWYSDRIERDHPDVVDQSADFLEEELGVLNLGQVDHKMLVADGVLTDQVKESLIAWWREKVEDLDLE